MLLSRKTKNQLGAQLNESVASTFGPNDFGMRMLAKFGWKEGKGLGRNEDGMREHVKVKQRAENLGLGAGVEDSAPSWAPPPSLARR